ncbi:MAG: hypothetical protein KDD76_04155 [Rickettsiales bacterium]|nr:hypothetical protein [Rickettsiales bacterium]
MPRKIVVVIACLMLVGCGFTPVYQQAASSGENAVAHPQLAKVAVQDVVERQGYGRSAQLLKVELQDLLDPHGATATPAYTLAIELRADREPMFIERDRRVTRYNLVVTAKYVLKDAKGKALTKGTSRMVGSYDKEASDFATIAAEQDTRHRAVKELARDIQQRLLAYFAGTGA